MAGAVKGSRKCIDCDQPASENCEQLRHFTTNVLCPVQVYEWQPGAPEPARKWEFLDTDEELKKLVLRGGQENPPAEGRVRWINFDGIFDYSKNGSQVEQSFLPAVSALFADLDHGDLLLRSLTPGAFSRVGLRQLDAHRFFILSAVFKSPPSSHDEAVAAVSDMREQIGFYVDTKTRVVVALQAGNVESDVWDAYKTQHLEGVAPKPSVVHFLWQLLDASFECHYPLMRRIKMKLDELEDNLSGPRYGVTKRAAAAIKETLEGLLIEMHAFAALVGTTLSSPAQQGENAVYFRERAVYFDDLHARSLDVVDGYEQLQLRTQALLDDIDSSTAAKQDTAQYVISVSLAVFSPLSFIVGIYGMNFIKPDGTPALPELTWEYGYRYLWGLLGAVTVAIAVMFFFSGIVSHFFPASCSRINQQSSKPQVEWTASTSSQRPSASTALGSEPRASNRKLNTIHPVE